MTEADLKTSMTREKGIRRELHTVQLRTLMLLIVSVFILAACTPQPADCAREDLFCVGMVTAYGGVADHGLNQVTWKTLQSIQTRTGMARLDKIESVDPRDWLKNVSFFAEHDYDVIVTVGRNLSEITTAVATEYPDIQFFGIDQQLEDEYANVAVIYFPEEQAGFLAGMLAAKATKANKVGAVCETSGIDSVWRYCEGFRAGARYENEEIRVVVTYRDSGSITSTFNDPEWGQEIASIQIEGGADVLSGFGGNTAQGAFLLAAEKGIPVIGAGDDLYFQLPEVQPVLITSMVYDPAEGLSYLVDQAAQGEVLHGPYVGQITYTSFQGPNKLLESDAEVFLKGIRNGAFEISLPPKE